MENESLNIIIPLNPVTKKNHGRIVNKKTKTGKVVPIMLPSEAYSNYEKKCKEFMPQLEKPIDYPINLCCHFFMETHRACDLTNLLQAVCDILVKYGVLQDDNYKIVATMNNSDVQYSKENPRTEIYISKKHVDI